MASHSIRMKIAWSAVLLLSVTLTLVQARRTDHGDIPAPDLEKFLTDQRRVDENKLYWEAVAQQELQEALSFQLNTNVAKNVIIFLGDGMGIPTITAARIYSGQQKNESVERGYLSFEKFPHSGLVKTYNVDFTVPDSAGTATAYICGVKTNMGIIGYDARVGRGLCETITPDSVVDSIAKLSQDKGKRTGLVTSTRVTHATPASVYSHTPERDFECDANLAGTCLDFKDIARQLVEDEPGRSLNVIMGGGFVTLDNDTIDYPADPVSIWDCVRKDGRKLWQDWLDDKASQGKVASFVRNKTALDAVDLASTEFLMGIFANNHVPFEYEKRELGLDLPTLREMTEAAIQILSQEPNGFFLLVEGGRIDLAHHSNNARAALDEAVAFDEAIQRALEMTSEQDTLIVVTADHSHTMTVNGYPERGTPITGIAGTDDSNFLPYTTLTYANGPGYNFTVVNGDVSRVDISEVDTSDFEYKQQTAAFMFSETHGGEDVAMYANGPMSHLFTSVHEQNYIARAMAYASCVDATGEHCIAKR